MNTARRLLFGPIDLVHVASLVMRIRVWTELLREAPGDAQARSEIRSLAAALVHYGDQHHWPELGDPAGRMVRGLAEPGEQAATERLQLLALQLEGVVTRRVEGGAR